MGREPGFSVTQTRDGQKRNYRYCPASFRFPEAVDLRATRIAARGHAWVPIGMPSSVLNARLLPIRMQDRCATSSAGTFVLMTSNNALDTRRVYYRNGDLKLGNPEWENWGDLARSRWEGEIENARLISRECD